MNDLKRVALPILKEELVKFVKYNVSDVQYPVIATALVVELPNGTGPLVIVTSGTAICKPEDEFDIEDGTNIAIKRALRLLARSLLNHPELPLVRRCYAKAAAKLAFGE